MIDNIFLLVIAPGLAIAVVWKGTAMIVTRGKNKREAMVNLSDRLKPPRG